MRNLLAYIEVGAVGGMLYYLSNAIQVDTFRVEDLLQCAGLGALGGVVPAMLREASGRRMPLLCSWTILAFLIFTMNFTLSSKSAIWQVLVFGYVSYLLWEGYHNRLDKY